MFTIPAELIAGETARLEIVGPRVSLAYWFFQEPAGGRESAPAPDAGTGSP